VERESLVVDYVDDPKERYVRVSTQDYAEEASDWYSLAGAEALFSPYARPLLSDLALLQPQWR
jgi:hypothetical protein